jgi:hypothetical protein
VGPSRWSKASKCPPTGVLCDGDSQGHHVTPSRNGEDWAPPPSLEVVLSSLVDSSRMASNDDDPLQTTPAKTAPRPFPFGERLRLPEWSVMNSKVP